MAKLMMRLTPLAGVLAFLLVWEIAVPLLKMPAYLLPPPSAIVRVFIDEFPKLAFHGWVTLYEMLMGYALAVVIAIPLAIAITSSERFDRFTMPTLLFFQVVPKVAIAPLFLVWFGVGVPDQTDRPGCRHRLKVGGRFRREGVGQRRARGCRRVAFDFQIAQRL